MTLDYNGNSISEIVENYEKNLEKNIVRYFDIDDYIALIDHYILSSNTNRAKMALDSGLSQHPNSLDLKHKEAEILTLTKDYSKALEIILQLEPLKNDIDLLLLKGNIMTTLNKLSDAKEVFRQAILMVEDSEELLDSYLKIGLSFQQAGKYKEAIKYLTKVFELSPTNEDNIFELSFCFEQLGMYPQCIQYYNLYLDENPYDHKAWYNMGIIYNRMQKYNKAIEAYDFVLAIHPKHKDAIFNKSNALFYLQKYDEALDGYTQCLNFLDNHALTHTYIGECFEKKESFELARLHYRKALKINENLTEAWFGLGMIAKLQNNFAEAIHCMKEALKTDNSYGEAHLEIARIHESMGEKTLALNSYRFTTTHAPDEWYYLLELVKFYHREGMVSLAIKTLKENKQNFVEEPEFYFFITLFYLLENNETEAKSNLTQGLLLDAEQIDTILFYCNENKKLVGDAIICNLKNLL